MPSESQVNVLLVDDHPENLLALEAILDALGQNLVKAYSGAEALRCLLNQDFAVILLDVQMPGMDGFETARLIRGREKSRHTPIIFLTAFNTSDAFVFKGYSLGAVDYLFKPINPEILTSKVTVFVELFKKTAEVKRQAAQLATVNSELRESEERFRSLSACSPVGIFMTNSAGNIVYTNPRWQAICNSPIQRSFTETWLQSVHPEDRNQVSTDWFIWTSQSQEYAHEFRLHQEEMVRWVHVRSSPLLSEQGAFLGHVGTLEDITERKQAEVAQTQFIREHEARQQAEAANRLKDEFLATLSHELRTPLNSMLGWARLLRSRKYDETTTARALETIERNARSQAQLIEDILDVSRIVQGKLRLCLSPVNLASVIESAVNSLRPAAEAKEIQLESIPDPMVDLVLGDSDRLQQVIWNLLSNALKFTPARGKVEVQVKRVVDMPPQHSPYAQITVTDTGIGIAQEFLPYVFDRFRQADGTTTRSHGGLGIGLAIVRHLVELHNGTIDAYSDGEGKGAMFTVKLLVADNYQKTNQPQQEHFPNSNGVPIAIPKLSGLQVLVVDDDPDTCDFLTTVLEQHGAGVTAVTSASEALEVLQKTMPDLLVSDIAMPGEDGYCLIRKVRALKAQGGIPAIALTAYASGEERSRAISAGYNMHLPKPVEPSQLIAVVANMDCFT